MFNRTICLTLALASPTLYAAENYHLYNQSLDSLSGFSINKQKKSLALQPSSANTLIAINQTQKGQIKSERYQQYYKGIPVIGSQVIIKKPINNNSLITAKPTVNGQITKNIQLAIAPTLSQQEAINIAKRAYKNQNTLSQQKIQLQIRLDKNEATLYYLISFRVNHPKLAWPHFLVKANDGTITKQWNNLKTFDDTGTGGNDKVGQYWYGKDGLPALDVKQKGARCIMDNDRVRLVDVHQQWDWQNKIKKPVRYRCGKPHDKPVNGGYGAVNDAYVIGDVIVNLYQNWYDLKALQLEDGSAMKLMMRVHFGQGFDNAFWDESENTMSFGDGNSFYPLVSLDVGGHEVSHGFTTQHSNLEYHDDSGALNESFSDMAGQSAKAYVDEETPLLYQKMYDKDYLSWTIGESITKPSSGMEALRYMDKPSKDGWSAECVDRNLANQSGGDCQISYQQLIDFVKMSTDDPQQQQSIIVHTASGIFNKFFYLLAQEIGVKKAFGIMINANLNYWTPTSDFHTAACGVVKASQDEKNNVGLVQVLFQKVGIKTTDC